nr:RNA polymerase beta subunit protein b [Cylindrocapsa geminella]
MKDIFMRGKNFISSICQTKEYVLPTYHRSNQDTSLISRPVVKEGEWVEAGDLLADCSASDGGELSLGYNILIAYMPWEGYNYEDAILISEKLVYDDIYTSIHIEKYELDIEETEQGLEQITREIPDVQLSELEKLDEHGIVRIGSWVQEGDILIGKVAPLKEDISSGYLKLLNVILEKEFYLGRDISLRVPKGIHAKVIDIQFFYRSNITQSEDEDPFKAMPESQNVQALTVYLAERRRIQVGDKMSGRHGNKGIVSQILPQQDMPYLPNGIPVDMVLNPLGVPSRMNVGQIYECLLGLAGKCLGDNYKIVPFDEIHGAETSRSLVYTQLYKARRETKQVWLFNPHHPGKIPLFDGRTGECFDQHITLGYSYIIKLVHLVDDKIHCLTPDHEVLTTKGWIPIAQITLQHKVAILDKGELNYDHPIQLHRYSHNGLMYNIQTPDLDLLVTLNHRMYVKKERMFSQNYIFLEAQEIRGKYFSYLKDAKLKKSNAEYCSSSFRLRKSDGGKTQRNSCSGKMLERVFCWCFHSLLQTKRFIERWIGEDNPEKKHILLKFLRFESLLSFPSFQIFTEDLTHRHLSAACIVTKFLLDSKGTFTKIRKNFSKKSLFGFSLRKSPERKRNDENGMKQKKQIERLISYEGPVYCLSVPRQAFYVRRRNFPVWTGNSRSTGPYSLVTQQPLKGRSKQGGQRVGEMEVWALEAYGAAFILLEILSLKSDDITGRMILWSNLFRNKKIHIGTPEAFKVLICELQALCLDIRLFQVTSKGLVKQIKELVKLEDFSVKHKHGFLEHLESNFHAYPEQ